MTKTPVVFLYPGWRLDQRKKTDLLISRPPVFTIRPGK
jgi:hypothetical protein